MHRRRFNGDLRNAHRMLIAGPSRAVASHRHHEQQQQQQQQPRRRLSGAVRPIVSNVESVASTITASDGCTVRCRRGRMKWTEPLTRRE